METDEAPPASTEPSLLLGVAEAAALLGIGRSATYNLMAEGKLRFVKIGARRLVPRASVHEFVDNLVCSSWSNDE
jgi:excisionase family DNA binding protein